MAKPKRGKNAKRIAGWRGSCPTCSRTGARLLWEKTVDGQKIKICKRCFASNAN